MLVISTVTFAQEINKTDANGKRHGNWKGVYEESNKPRYQGSFIHGKESGTFTFYKDDEKSTIMATRVFKPDGSSYTTFFDEKGLKVSEGKEVNRQREGEWKFYHPGGTTLMSVEHYKAGKLNGVRKVYFPDGKINEETTFVNGIQQGPYKKYTTDGVVLEESIYKNDILQGRAIFHDARGNIAAEGNYDAGVKTGEWKYYEDGKLVKKVDETGKHIKIVHKKDSKN
ncbi:toxin-antitoxin system YwqK family antitoxin [Flavobacterium rhizosphaerae]